MTIRAFMPGNAVSDEHWNEIFKKPGGETSPAEEQKATNADAVTPAAGEPEPAGDIRPPGITTADVSAIFPGWYVVDGTCWRWDEAHANFWADVVSCLAVTGWAVDPDRPRSSSARRWGGREPR